MHGPGAKEVEHGRLSFEILSDRHGKNMKAESEDHAYHHQAQAPEGVCTAHGIQSMRHRLL